MTVTVHKIMGIVEELAPGRLAESWDNVGLQLGSATNKVNKVFLALDLSDSVLTEAIGWGADLIITHHPVIFQGITHLRTDLPLGRRLAKLIQNDINVYVAHTNLDIAENGLNDLLARQLGLESVSVLKVNGHQEYYKLVVFVPEGYQDEVLEAISKVGAGWIGNYSHCSFQAPGTGTFKGETGINPFIGKPGELEKAKELRLETIVPKENLSLVLRAMLEVHPYEEVAYDLYPLANTGPAYGLGRIGTLSQEMTLKDFAEVVKGRLNVSQVRVWGELNREIKTVGLCGGAGAELITTAAFRGADVFLSADIKYHDGQKAADAGMAVIDAGHFSTERPVIPYLAEYIKYRLKDEVEVKFALKEEEPWQFI